MQRLEAELEQAVAEKAAAAELEEKHKRECEAWSKQNIKLLQEAHPERRKIQDAHCQLDSASTDEKFLIGAYPEYPEWQKTVTENNKKITAHAEALEQMKRRHRNELNAVQKSTDTVDKQAEEARQARTQPMNVPDIDFFKGKTPTQIMDALPSFERHCGVETSGFEKEDMNDALAEDFSIADVHSVTDDNIDPQQLAKLVVEHFQQIQQQVKFECSMAEKQTDWTCLFCHQFFIFPVTAPCGHTFCKPCVRKLSARGEAGPKRRCPTCKSQFDRNFCRRSKVNRAMVAKMFQNSVLSQEEYREAAKTKTEDAIACILDTMSRDLSCRVKLRRFLPEFICRDYLDNGLDVTVGPKRFTMYLGKQLRRPDEAPFVRIGKVTGFDPYAELWKCEYADGTVEDYTKTELKQGIKAYNSQKATVGDDDEFERCQEQFKFLNGGKRAKGWSNLAEHKKLPWIKKKIAEAQKNAAELERPFKRARLPDTGADIYWT